jgi:hypothetical protein
MILYAKVSLRRKAINSSEEKGGRCIRYVAVRPEQVAARGLQACVRRLWREGETHQSNKKERGASLRARSLPQCDWRRLGELHPHKILQTQPSQD